jgi:tetratricopeptide (TPR) repeat protein
MKIRSIISVFTIFFSTILVASCSNAQSPKDVDTTSPFKKITYTEWKEEAKTNIRLLPKYGNVPKTDEQKDADRELIETYVKQQGTRSKASAVLIDLGFDYLARMDIKTAMYRFNQAWLLDSTNVDTYWGYGAVYHTLGDYKRALEQYDLGLSIDPKNPRIITDKATVYLVYYQVNNDLNNLINAITLLEQSYIIDSKNQNTLFKLSICWFLKNDCKKARRYYEECMDLGGKPITLEFTNALKEKCKEN